MAALVANVVSFIATTNKLLVIDFFTNDATHSFKNWKTFYYQTNCFRPYEFLPHLTQVVDFPQIQIRCRRPLCCFEKKNFEPIVENDRNKFWNANGPVVGKNSQNIDAFCTLVFRLVQNENTEYICKIESFLVFLFSKLLFN